MGEVRTGFDAIDRAYKKAIDHAPRHLDTVNEKYECVRLLKRLNMMIETLAELTDEYYTEYIWNSSTLQDGWMKKNGFTTDYFMELEDKFITLRAVLFGDNLDWNALYVSLAEDVMKEQQWWVDHYEEWNERLRTEREREMKK